MKVEEKEFREASALRVKVSTTGYMGGDAGHGGRTILYLRDADASHIEIKIDTDGRGVTIELAGDSELSTLIQSLEFAVESLRRNT